MDALLGKGHEISFCVYVCLREEEQRMETSSAEYV
jgi:hypothetical protein